VAGISPSLGGSGNPSVPTAQGIVCAMEGALSVSTQEYPVRVSTGRAAARLRDVWERPLSISEPTAEPTHCAMETCV
jgi:hypothetical protein